MTRIVKIAAVLLLTMFCGAAFPGQESNAIVTTTTGGALKNSATNKQNLLDATQTLPPAIVQQPSRVSNQQQANLPATVHPNPNAGMLTIGNIEDRSFKEASLLVGNLANSISSVTLTLQFFTGFVAVIGILGGFISVRLIRSKLLADNRSQFFEMEVAIKKDLETKLDEKIDEMLCAQQQKTHNFLRSLLDEYAMQNEDSRLDMYRLAEELIENIQTRTGGDNVSKPLADYHRRLLNLSRLYSHLASDIEQSLFEISRRYPDKVYLHRLRVLENNYEGNQNPIAMDLLPLVKDAIRACRQEKPLKEGDLRTSPVPQEDPGAP